MIDFVEAVQDRLVVGFVDLIETRLIRTALHVGGGKFLWQDLLQKWNILFHQLLLQVLGTGRDDYPLLCANRFGDRRDEIRECFAGSGRRLDNEVLFLVKRLCDRLCHFDLAVTILVALVKLRNEAVRSKNRLNQIVVGLYRLFSTQVLCCNSIEMSCCLTR